MAQDTRRPTGDSASYDQWSASAGARWECIDEATANGDTDYVLTGTDGAYQAFTFTPFTVPAGATVNWVRVYATAKYQTTSGALKLGVTKETNDHSLASASAHTLTASYAEYFTELTQNPFTSAAWTVNQINSEGSTADRLTEMIIRKLDSTSNEIRVTNLWLVVDYTVPTPVAPLPLAYVRPRRNTRRRRAA